VKESFDHRQGGVLFFVGVVVLSGVADVAAGGPVATVDSDGDGLSDATEDALGTDPNDVDTDGDGIDAIDETNKSSIACEGCY
jgi:hypothetical protein